MLNVHLLKYLKSNIEKDYTLEVLYYCLRKEMELHDFSLTSSGLVNISEKFLQGAICINLHTAITDQISSFALLLSLRAIYLDRSLIDYCKTDDLIFGQRPTKHSWLNKASIILDFVSDDDFKHLFQALDELNLDGSLSEETKEQFVNDTVKPEYRNLNAYYKSLAMRNDIIFKEVIPDNAFVANDSISKYIVPDEVKYIGNTAFAYCNNLKFIYISNPNILFGFFPIIECPNIRKIIVPEGSEEYYKESLPYFSNVITSTECLSEDDSGESSSNAMNGDFKENVENAESEIDIPSYDKIIEEPVPKIDVKTLKNVFDKKVTTYKYFWFLSIILLFLFSARFCPKKVILLLIR